MSKFLYLKYVWCNVVASWKEKGTEIFNVVSHFSINPKTMINLNKSVGPS